MEVGPLAVITGGSSGIGLALARRLAVSGWTLALVARDAGRLEAAAAELPATTTTHPCDVGDPAELAALAATLTARSDGRIGLLVCNAGMPGGAGALDVTPERARRVMDVNYHGMVGLTRLLWPSLVTAHGRVVNVCSVAGTVALASSAPYAASKHAAVAWSRALAVAAPRDGVRVLTVNPGPVPTPGFPQTALVRHRLWRHATVTADDCAAAIERAIVRDRREIFVPPFWRLAGVLQALAPGTVARLAATRPGRGADR